jgi:glycosyltransferase involved in cell wall biosynthesis
MEFAYREIADCRCVTMINNSAAGAKDYAQWLQIPVARFVVKRNGLDMTTMKRSTGDVVARMRAQLKIPEYAAVVGSIFRFYNEKRPFLWIKVAREVAHRYPETHFVVFGEGILVQEAVAMARDVGIGNHFHAPGNINDVAVGLSLFDVFLLTSQFEGTPNVVLEASFLGVPVVSTDAGGTAEAIDQGVTGFLVNSVEPDVIANRIVEILSDDSWRSKVAREGPVFVERRFSLSRMITETLQLYKIPHA